jgi:hypothetical protein
MECGEKKIIGARDFLHEREYEHTENVALVYAEVSPTIVTRFVNKAISDFACQ